MKEIKIKVLVPEGLEGIFEKELDALVKGLRRLARKPAVTVDDVFGIMPTEKSVREMRLEAYEELFS
ncbi:hypothetical protein [Thermococcus sp.]